MMASMEEIQQFLAPIRALHERIRDRVLEAFRSQSIDDLASVDGDDPSSGDLVFAIDRVSEAELVHFISQEISEHEPIVLIAEGLPGGKRVLPEGKCESDCRWRLIVDPIDGTRPFLYQKRPAWILTGVAPNRGPQTNLADIQLAVQTEIPLLKQNLCDQLWAIRGEGDHAERLDLKTGNRQPLQLAPSTATTLQFGYASISRFFPGMRDVLAAIDDAIMQRVLGPQPPEGTLCFEDQYPSTGGQLHSLLSGADRFLADLRPLMKKLAEQRGENMGHCCHPYDIGTLLIAEELGVQITDPWGKPLDALLDVRTDVAWVGYANPQIREQVEPALQEVLREFGLTPR